MTEDTLAADFLLGNITAEAMAVVAAQPPAVDGAAAADEAVTESFEHMEADVVRLCRCVVVRARRQKDGGCDLIDALGLYRTFALWKQRGHPIDGDVCGWFHLDDAGGGPWRWRSSV